MTENTAQSVDSFLGNLQSLMTAHVISVTKYAIDEESKGATIWVKKQQSENQNILGNELIKIKCDYDMFQQLENKVKEKTLSCPGHWQMLVEVQLGGANKAGLKCLSVSGQVPDNPTSNKKSTTPTTNAK
jgi:hypothetical protein